MTIFKLKIIASICMLLDHTGAVFIASTPYFFRLIGRVAFPVYAFMIAQGCKYTKNIKKYLFRLGVFALISEIPFDIAFNNFNGENIFLSINFLRHTNVFYTLFLGVACIAVYEGLKTKRRQWLAFLPFPFLPAILLVNFLPENFPIGPNTIAAVVMAMYTAGALCFAHFLKESDDEVTIKKKVIPLFAALTVIITAGAFKTDYEMFGTGLIFALYLANPQNRFRQVAVLAAAAIYHYALGANGVISTSMELVDGVFTQVGYAINWRSVFSTLFALVSAVLVLFYNGKRGCDVKWLFYAF